MPIYSYKNNAGETLYRVAYRKPDHSQGTRRGFTRKRDAQEFLDNLQVSKRRGEYIDPRDSKVTIRELGETWIATQTHLKPSSFHSEESAYRVHVLPTWGDVPLKDIRFSKVQEWVSNLSTTKSASIVIRCHGILSRIIDLAVKDRRLLENPAKGVNLPKKGKKARAYLTHKQVQALAEASGQHSTLVYFLAYTGLRWGEAIGLKIKSLDLLKKRVSVSENAVEISGVIQVGTPKSHEFRTVPLPDFLLPMLGQLCEGKGRESLVFGDGHNYLSRSTTSRGWLDKAVKRCQEVDPDFPRVTAHDLRHTSASLAVSAGANVKALQKMLGHASASMTLDIYADLFDGDLDNVAEALNKARSESNVVKMLSRASNG